MKRAEIAEKGRELKGKAQEWQETAKEQAIRARKAAADYVHENTWSSLALAAGVGCILGLVLAKMRD